MPQEYPLTSEERRQGGFTHRFIVTHADLTEGTAATAQTLVLKVLRNGHLIRAVATRLTETFAQAGDAANNTTAITVGDDGSANRFLVSQELNVNGTEILNKAGTGTPMAYSAADNLKITFAAPAAGKTLLALDSGEVVIMAEIVDLVQVAG